MRNQFASAWILVLFCGVAGTETVQAADPAQPLAMRLRYQNKKLNWEIVNTGKESVTLACAGRCYMDSGDQPPLLRLWIELPVGKDKIKLIPSESDLRIVKLNQNEAARLTFDTEDEYSRGLVAWQALFDLNENAEKSQLFTVEYEVSEEVGKRFGVWHGKVTTKAHIIRK